MQTLVFNTTDKTVNVYSGQVSESDLIFQFENVLTDKIYESGFYEVIQKDNEGMGMPILRLPICSTNMRIVK